MARIIFEKVLDECFESDYTIASSRFFGLTFLRDAPENVCRDHIIEDVDGFRLLAEGDALRL
jgi:hypothetical protein